MNDDGALLILIGVFMFLAISLIPETPRWGYWTSVAVCVALGTVTVAAGIGRLSL